MKKIAFFTIKALFFLIILESYSQEYKYSIDLTNVNNDKLSVQLETPSVSQKTINFWMPRIIPGTYRESNYGRFISEVKALDKKGKPLPVKQLSDNSWEISKADKLSRITYTVDDIFDADFEHNIFMMAASNIEQNRNFVIQSPAFFGYLEGKKNLPFEVNITKPVNFYGSTGLIPTFTSPEKDIYKTRDYDQLIDSPFMYNVPDTTFINVGNAKVLVSVYSPQRKVTSSYLASHLGKMLQAQKSYLGNKLPVDKYAFLLYFANPEDANPMQGALEHGQSSFYYFSEAPQEAMANYLVDVSAHEFFHIMTPLSIHSEKIANFNFQEPELSKHLWLYEGVTEYASHHIQVRSGLNTPDEFLMKLAGKINTSKSNFNDNLAFTELSKESAGEHADQYQNVYQKGALIGAMLDILLIEKSGGEMDLQDLILRLSQKFGQNNPFEDDKLFASIEEITFPDVGKFFKTYVSGSNPIPYEEFFKKVGIILNKEPDRKGASFGKPGIGMNQEKQLLEIVHTHEMNEFGKNIEFLKGDLLISLQGEPLSPATAGAVIEKYNNTTKENQMVEVTVLRSEEGGEYREVILTAPAMMVTAVGSITLSFNPNATVEQLKRRSIWLHEHPLVVASEDVKNPDTVVATLYDVLSGPAGERNWDRFHSLFKPEARMAAMVPIPGGKVALKTFKPQEYQAMNSPHFVNSGFYEIEIGRVQEMFGEIAHVWSAYEFKSAPDARVEQRGINSIQLVKDQNRWWITNILWNAEREDNKIPDNLLVEKE